MAAEQQSQPEPEIGGFDICVFGHAERRAKERFTATVDSGAAVCVMPVETAARYNVKPSKASQEGATYRAAGGVRIPELEDVEGEDFGRAEHADVQCGGGEQGIAFIGQDSGPRQPSAVWTATGGLLYRSPEYPKADASGQAQGRLCHRFRCGRP